MDPRENLNHWQAWASQFGAELRATTKCMSIKRIELDALERRIAELREPGKPIHVLEIGCGNGVNGFALAARIPEVRYVGLDFAPAMIENAVGTCAAQPSEAVSRLAFGVGDLRKLDGKIAIDTSGPHVIGADALSAGPEGGFDVVFTDRVLINLADAAEQLASMRKMRSLVKPGGRFLMLENSKQTHARLNDARGALGLPVRPAAEYNVFIDEPTVIEPFSAEMALDAVDDFSAMHDLLLYAVLPSVNEGEIVYDSPVMTRLADVIGALGSLAPAGPVGQNHLWVFRR